MDPFAEGITNNQEDSRLKLEESKMNSIRGNLGRGQGTVKYLVGEPFAVTQDEQVLH